MSLLRTEELNYCIWRYLEEAGYLHTAYLFEREARIAETGIVHSSVPVGHLVATVLKGLQFGAIETHVGEDGQERPCSAPFLLTVPHVCSRATEKGNSVKKQRPVTNQKQVIPRRKKEATVSPLDFNGVVLTGHRDEVTVCAWHPELKDILVSASVDGTVRLWSGAEGGVVLEIQDSNVTSKSGGYTALAWNEQGTILAAASYAGDLCFWAYPETSTTLLIKKEQGGHHGPVFALKWVSPCSLLTSGYDQRVHLWEVSTHDLVLRFSLLSTWHDHSGPILDLDWCAERECFATGSNDKSVVVRGLGDSADSLPKVLIGHQAEINALAFCPKEDTSPLLLASCSDDHTARVK